MKWYKYKEGQINGPDELPIENFKQGTQKLFQFHEYAVTFSIEKNLLPEWKTTYVSYLYKMGDRRICENHEEFNMQNVMQDLQEIIKDRI